MKSTEIHLIFALQTNDRLKDIEHEYSDRGMKASEVS